jgi:hypothetical protein
MRTNSRMNSDYVHIPYEYRTRSLTMAEALNYRYTTKSIDTFNGEELIETKTMRFMNEAHYNMCMHHWNTMGERMSHTPDPVTGKIVHWKYKETPNG